jgi:hypothetical protein
VKEEEEREKKRLIFTNYCFNKEHGHLTRGLAAMLRLKREQQKYLAIIALNAID